MRNKTDSYHIKLSFDTATTILDKDYIETIITDDSKFLLEDDHTINEYLHCCWKAEGVQHEDGTFNLDKIVEVTQYFPREYFGGNCYDYTPDGKEIAVIATENSKENLTGFVIKPKLHIVGLI